MNDNNGIVAYLKGDGLHKVRDKSVIAAAEF